MGSEGEAHWTSDLRLINRRLLAMKRASWLIADSGFNLVQPENGCR